MFDIKILGYSFDHEYNDKEYPIVKIEARHEDEFLCMPITFERVYDARYLSLPNVIKYFVDELWKEFHKGIPRVYEIRLYITLPSVIPYRVSEQIISHEFEKCLAIKREEDRYYRLLFNMRFGLGIEPDDNHCYMVLPRGSSKWEAQMKMFESYIKTGKVEFVPNRDIRTLYKDTDLADSIVDTLRYAQYDMNEVVRAKEKIKEYEKMKIKNVIFNDPATIVFWRDGSKTVVKAQNEPFDKEKGLAMAIAKKVYGNKYNYYNTLKHWLKKYEPKEDNKNE